MPPHVFTIRAATIIPALLVARVTTAHADEPRAQIQADLGLSVICVGYEHPVAQRVTVFAGAGISARTSCGGSIAATRRSAVSATSA